jgi:hypothetical protein
LASKVPLSALLLPISNIDSPILASRLISSLMKQWTLHSGTMDVPDMQSWVPEDLDYD